MLQFLPASGQGPVSLPRDAGVLWGIFRAQMRLHRIILMWFFLAATPFEGSSAQPPAAIEEAVQASGAAADKTTEAALPEKALELTRINTPFGAFTITNSMVVTWIVALGLIVFAQVAMRRMKEIPEGAQNFWEWLVESLYDFLDSIIGPELVKKTFWFFATIFIFILFTNWFGLIPGIGTIGWGEQTAHGFHITRPLLRGGNADLNMTSAMACIFMVLWLIWALKSNGIVGFAVHLFGPKGEASGFIKYMMIVVFFAVGFLELLSIAFRPISLSFRLYGNIFAGENLLEAMSNTVQHPAWARAVCGALLPVPFYLLEVLVGLVQAFVFMLLTAVFTALICTHDDEHAKVEHP
jgi:F-type H+-transporting ATPase subunit a